MLIGVSEKLRLLPGKLGRHAHAQERCRKLSPPLTWSLHTQEVTDEKTCKLPACESKVCTNTQKEPFHKARGTYHSRHLRDSLSNYLPTNKLTQQRLQ
jgi:hypothetical protein